MTKRLTKKHTLNGTIRDAIGEIAREHRKDIAVHRLRACEIATLWNEYI
jgi:hypothetical protein